MLIINYYNYGNSFIRKSILVTTGTIEKFPSFSQKQKFAKQENNYYNFPRNLLNIFLLFALSFSFFCASEKLIRCHLRRQINVLKDTHFEISASNSLVLCAVTFIAMASSASWDFKRNCSS